MLSVPFYEFPLVIDYSWLLKCVYTATRKAAWPTYQEDARPGRVSQAIPEPIKFLCLPSCGIAVYFDVIPTFFLP